MELGELVGRLGSAILGVDDFHTLLQEATELIATAAGAEFVSIQLEQGGSRWEYRWDRHGLVPAGFAPRIAARVSAAGHRSEVLTAGLSEYGLRCAVVAPVALSKDDGLSLCVAFGEPGRILPNEDVRAIEAVAGVLALGASRHAYQQLAVLDSWTHLYNRRWLDMTLPGELERVRRYRQPLAVIAIDIDHFKRVNDTNGHGIGDKVLLGVARSIQESIRSCDAAVRMGGDEFLLLLPETGKQGVDTLARRLEDRVRQLSFGDARKPVRVTISGGAAFADGLTTPEALLDAADKQLYAAKTDGRDRIVVPAPAAPRERDREQVRVARGQSRVTPSPL